MQAKTVAVLITAAAVIVTSCSKDPAVSKREAFESCSIRAAHDLEARARRVRQSRSVEGVDAVQRFLDAGGTLVTQADHGPAYLVARAAGEVVQAHVADPAGERA